MRIPKKELKALEGIYYNSEDYYITDGENYDYNYTLSESDYKAIRDTIDGLIESYIIVTGTMGLWDRTVDIDPHQFTEFQEFMNRIHEAEQLTIEFDKKEKAIVVRKTHHDGINVYYIRKPEWYTKNELEEMLEDYYDTREEMNEDARYYFDKSFSELNKDELIELLSNYLER